LVVGLTVLASGAVATSVADTAQASGWSRVVSTEDSNLPVDRLVVQRIPGQSTRAARDVVAESYELAIDDSRRLGNGFETITFATPIPVVEARRLADELVARGLVVSAEIDGVRSSTVVPNDPRFSEQWHLQTPGTSTASIDLPTAWEITRGSSNVVVAVIDTGRLDHPDVSGRLTDGYDFTSRTRDSKDGDGWDADESDVGDWSEPNHPDYTCIAGQSFQASTWHGTHVAGIIGAEADNSLGIAGIAPGVRVQHVRILGTCGGRTSDEAAAIRWAAGLPVPGVPLNPTPAKVINLSLGSATACQPIEQSAIDDAVAAGSVVVVAAGNSGFDLDTNSFAPANCANVVNVGSIRSDGSRAAYTNYGSLVDIAAPGGPAGILSLANGGQRFADANWTYGYKQGTSMSTPIVSGVVALMLSENPNLTPAQIESILKTSARPFPTAVSTPCSSNPADTFHCGAGIIDPVAALRLVGAQATPSPTPDAGTTPSTRLGSGGDRFATNLAIEALADRTDVILVSGSVYPDGLAASALSKQENADIVLVPATGLGPAQIQAIVAEKPQTVWIIGGPQAIPTTVETQLTAPTSLGGAGIEVSRIQRVFGPTRFDTAVEVSKRIETIAYLAAQPTAIVVRGDSFADAVIAGPASYGITGGIGSHPIFLVNRDSIPAGVVEQLRSRGITNVLIVGGTAVVSEAVRLGIQSLGISVTRVAGADRHATAASLSQLLITPVQFGGFGWNAGDVALVDIADSSQGFDAISAVGLLGPTRRILLGVTPTRLPDATTAYLRTLRTLTTRLTVIGNATAVSDAVVNEARLALA
jgi:serine protease